MTRVANTSGLYNTFSQTDFDDPNGLITKLPDATLSHMDKMPPFITEWQAKDIINNDVGEYYTNPMVAVATGLRDVAKHIVYSSTDVTNLTTMRVKAQALADQANTFIQHTNRLSGVTKYQGGDDPNNPYLDIAMNYGKTVTYIVYQTDGIDDNSAIMSSFTSLLIQPQLDANLNIMTVYAGNVANSIVATTTTTYDEYNQPTTTTTYSSNLTSQSITTVNDRMDNIKSFMSTRQQKDIDYFTNMKMFIDKYNETKKFNRMGATENNMVQNLIGSDKLKERLNS